MLRVIRYMKPFDDEKHLWNWLVRILKSTMIDFYRRNFKKLPSELQFQQKDSVDQNKSILLNILSEALEDLNDEEREIIEAYYFKKLPQKNIAESKKISKDALAMKMMRIRKSLKNFISRRLSHG